MHAPVHFAAHLRPLQHVVLSDQAGQVAYLFTEHVLRAHDPLRHPSPRHHSPLRQGSRNPERGVDNISRGDQDMHWSRPNRGYVRNNGAHQREFQFYGNCLVGKYAGVEPREERSEYDQYDDRKQEKDEAES